MKEVVQFGYHLTLDLYECPKAQLLSMDFSRVLLEDLVVLLGMTPLMPPYLIKANSNEDKGGKDPGGITGFIVIAESHISIHTFALRGFVSMDIYSCKYFDYDRAIEYIKHRLKPQKIEINKINRGIKYPSKNIYA